MGMDDDFKEIFDYAHFWNWLPDWGVAQKIYQKFPDSYSVLTPFAYSYLEEIIRSTTSEYGIELLDTSGKPKRRKLGIKLINLAINENCGNDEYISLLEATKPYFSTSSRTDDGDNRNSVLHGYMHPRFWNKDSFEGLIHHIALLSKYSGF